MGEYTEFSAKTKGEAILKACTELRVSSDQLDIQVVTEGSSGFFGFGSKPAVIRARRIQEDHTEDEIKDILGNVKAGSILEETKKPDTKKRQNDKKEKTPEKGQNKNVQEGSAAGAEEAGKNRPVKAEPEKAPVVEEEAEYKESPAAEEAASSSRSSQARSKNSRSRSKSQRNTKKGPEPFETETAQKETTEEAAEHSEKTEKPEKQSRPVRILTDPEEIAELENRAADFLKNVFATMDLGEVQITSKYNSQEGCLDVDFEGEDMGVLIGKRGQTLDSLQYLTSLVVNKGKDDYVRVKLDTEDYRRRRKETLENLARGIAYKVKKTHRPVVLEPMNPYERRIIHASLQGNKYVETISEGEEPYRHVVVKMKRW